MSPYNKLFTKTAFRNVPMIDATRGEDDPMCRVKFFSPLSGWAWYVIEYDPSTGLAFGLVQGHEIELGNFPVQEIDPGDWEGDSLQCQNNNWRQRGFRMPPIERDAHFKPMPLSKVRERCEAGNRP